MSKIERGQLFNITNRRISAYGIPVEMRRERPGSEYQGPDVRADLAVCREKDGNIKFLGDFVWLRGTLGDLWQYQQDTLDFIGRYFLAVEDKKTSK